MTPIDPRGMAEATSLTRSGRLQEATALIQRLLARGPGSGPMAGESWQGPTLDLEAEPAVEVAAPSRNATALPGRWLDGAYANPFGRRPYKLYVPASRAEGPLPLLVMLHGCTQDPDDFALGTGMNRLAEEKGVIVVYPGQVESANPSKCWNWFQPSDQERSRGEPSLIAGITRTVRQEHSADPSRVYVAGLSAGGAQALVMAATYPDLYAAVGVHSGLAYDSASDVPSAFAAMRRPAGARSGASGSFVPTIILHGDRDRTVHPGNAAAILDAALGVAGPIEERVEKGRAADGLAYRRRRFAAPDGRIMLEDWQVRGLGHAWSGGDARGSYTEPKGPDASRAMVDFFLGHRLSRPS